MALLPLLFHNIAHHCLRVKQYDYLVELVYQHKEHSSLPFARLDTTAHHREIIKSSAPPDLSVAKDLTYLWNAQSLRDVQRGVAETCRLARWLF
jgi:hypothetical protein